MEESYKFFNKLEDIIFILTTTNNISWINNYATKFFCREELIKLNFYTKFNIKDEIKENQIINDESGRMFKIKYCNNIKSDFKFIMMSCINDYQDEKIRLNCLEQIIESIDNGIIVSDIEGKVVLYNKGQEYLENKRKENVIGKKLWEVYDYGKGNKSEHRRVYNTKQPIKDAYKTFNYKDGTFKEAHYNTYPIKIDGNMAGVFSVSTNEKILQELLLETIHLKRQLANQNIEDTLKYNNKNGTRYNFSSIVGGKKISSLIKLSQKIALLESNILIIGETGTGKEVFAQSIHNYGQNKNESFIPINCAAIPENLLESILFGTVKGSYTGSTDTPGLFEEAGRGTIFLDELNSMPISMQTKLLRVIQERRTTRIGSSKMYNIECRIISAINEEPKALMIENRLRQDLFYRISSLTIKIPPLRERKEDIGLLSKFYISKYNLRLNKDIQGISKDLLRILESHNWPGNIRELEHIIENLIIACEDENKIIGMECLSEYIEDELNLNIETNYNVDINKKIPKDINIYLDGKENLSLSEILKYIEKKIIMNTLQENSWNISKSAEKLNIIRQSLIYRIKKLGITK